MMDKCRVYILYRYPLFGFGIQSILSRCSEVEIVGMGRDPGLALEQMRALKPDIIMLDGPCGPEVLGSVSRILEQNLGEKVIALNLGDNTVEVFRKHQVLVRRPEDLIDAIRSA